MAIEQARVHLLQKPWGVSNLSPWNGAHHDGSAIGEIWFERQDKTAVRPSLLLKLLFTSQPLSIQVHPDDVFARSIGLPKGKSEAWYVLSATPEAKVALGLKQRATSQQLRAAVEDSSILNLVAWRSVSADDIIYVPAGTIHAIGAGLVIAEIQQRSDATFRLFDHGRQRELHIENAIAVASTTRADFQAKPSRLSGERIILVSSPHFVFEKIDLPPRSSWLLKAERETWLLVVSGGARVGSLDTVTGDAVFAQAEDVSVHAGETGMTGLVAYTGTTPVRHLLQPLERPVHVDRLQPKEMSTLTPAKTAP